MEKLNNMSNDENTINQGDRAWFIFPDGRIKSGLSHRSILKNTFEKEWNSMINAGAEPHEIERIFDYRLLMTGVVRIGEFKDHYYVELQKLDKTEKDILQIFSKSLLLNNNIGYMKVKIKQIDLNETNYFEYSLLELSMGI